MNILVIVSSLNFGGAEKQAIADANMLSPTNEILLVTFENGPLKELLSEDVKHIVLKKKNYFITSFQLISIIRKFKISIIHSHLYAPMVISSISGMFTSTPVIWNFHTHSYSDSRLGKRLHKISAMLPSVKQILFPAAELIKYYETDGYEFSPKKIVLAYNSGNELQEIKSEIVNKGGDVIQIGYIGRVVKIKRIHLLLELAEHFIEKGFEKFCINIIGDGPELEKIKELARKKKILDFVMFHGFQKNTASYYKHFDIFVLPSEEEVLSLSLIDAAFHSIPVVAFDVGGNSEVISDKETGFLVKSFEDFASRVFELVEDKELCVRLGLNARKTCQGKFNLASRYNQLNEIYAKFI